MQSTAGTNLATTAVTHPRRPCYRVRIDWARLGWSLASSWYDESAYLHSLSLRSQAQDLRGQSVLGSWVRGEGTLTLDNPGGRYYPHNPSSPIHSYIQDGKIVGVPVDIYLGFYSGTTPEYLVQFSGYIASPAIMLRGGKVSFALRDRAWDLEQRRESTSLYQGVYPDDYLTALNELVPAASRPSTDLDRGLFPLMFAWLDDESIWDEMKGVAAAQGGLLWFSKGGALTFRDGSYFARATTSCHTFTTCKDWQESWSESEVWNHVVVRWAGGRVARLQEVWALPEPIGHPIAPGSSEPVKATLHTPVAAMAVPEAKDDYKAIGYDGSDATDDLGVTTLAYAARVNLTLTNNGTKPLYVTRLRLRGYPVDFQDEQQVEAEDATSIARFGRRTLTVNLVYVQSKSQAEAVRDLLLARGKVPRATYRLTHPAIPWLEIGDRVTVNISKVGVNEDFYIVGLDTRFEVPSGYEHTYTLLRAADLLPYSNWFVVGTTALGTHGRYFY